MMQAMAMQPQPTNVGKAARPRGAARNRAGFVLFILVNAALFVRPADAIAALEGLPLYEGLILACLAVSLPALAASLRRPTTRPITVMVLALLPAVMLSHLAHFALGEAIAKGIQFAKMLVYFLLLISVVNTAARLRMFLLSVGLFVATMSALAVLDYRGIIDLPGVSPVMDGDLDAASGQDVTFARLRGAGIFNDPNDFCQILGVGLVLGAYGLFYGGRTWRPVWLGAVAIMGYAVTLTHSRGGFLGVLAGIGMLILTRFGLRRSVMVGLVALPAMLVVFGGRQTAISTSSQTGQERIQLWSDALEVFTANPVFGIGSGKFGEGETNLVAHNTFIHEFAELGFVGGTLFLGAYATALLSLHRLRRRESSIGDGQLAGMRPFVTAAVAAYAAGMMSLSRGYDVPTYMMLGMAAVYWRLVERDWGIRGPRIHGKGLVGVLGISLGFLMAAHVFVRWSVHWG
jgi:O-antigen ligase